MFRTAALSVLTALLLPATAAADGSWAWPVEGAIAGRFHYEQSTPFLGGQRRGIEIATTPGTTVRSACSGTVTFAGSVAGSGPLVAMRCSDLNATYLHLGAINVHRGDRVFPGKRIGQAGSERLYLGAKKIGTRFGYIDPLTLLGEGKTPPTVGAIPWRTELGPRAAPLFAHVRAAAFATRVNVIAPGVRIDLIALAVGAALLALLAMYGFTRRFVHTKIEICQYKHGGKRSSRLDVLRLGFASSRRTSASMFTKRAWDRRS